MPFYRNVKQSSGEQRPTMGFVTEGPVDTDIVQDATDGYAFSSVTINPLTHTEMIAPTRTNNPTQDIGQYHENRYINRTGFIDNTNAKINESDNYTSSYQDASYYNLAIMGNTGGRYFQAMVSELQTKPLAHNILVDRNDIVYPNCISASSGIDLGFSHPTTMVNYNFNLGGRWQVFKYAYSGGNQVVLTFDKPVSNFFYMSSNGTGPAIGMWIRSYNGSNPSTYAFYAGSGTYFKRYALPSTNNYYMNSVSSDCKTFTLNKFGTGSGTAYFAVVFW